MKLPKAAVAALLLATCGAANAARWFWANP